MRTSVPLRRWRLRPRADERLLRSTGVTPLVLAQLLLNRGYEPAQALGALSAIDAPLGDPARMAGLPQAVERLRAAIAAGEPVGVYGDYDVDGLTGAAILLRALAALGVWAIPYIPDRVADGYGVSRQGLEYLAREGVRLVLTVDCGISAREEVLLARALGLDVIVTDHHAVPAEVPEAVAVLNPRQQHCAYPFKHLSGAGVAYTLMRGLYQALPGVAHWAALDDQLLQLAALGAIADVVPLRHENRTLVARGLQALCATPLVGLRELVASAGRSLATMDAESVSFVLAPRLNAAGRMASALPALELLTTNDRTRARALAAELERLNRQRQADLRQHLERAREALALKLDRAAVVVAGDFPLGLVGLLAGRLAEECARPAVVLRVADGVARGSARAPLGIDLVAALQPTASLLTRFGGHERAAGLTLDSAQLEAFEALFSQAIAERWEAGGALPTLSIDCALRHTSINRETLAAVLALEPCGAGNERPIFLSRDLRVRSVQIVGKEHARLYLEGSGRVFRAIAFRRAGDIPAAGQCVDLVFHLRPDRSGAFEPELEVLDWRHSTLDLAPSAPYTREQGMRLES